MIVTDVQFVKSAVKPSQYPPADCFEIAFAGRSNTGKSSLINTVVERKSLVRTSSKPGFTQLINFYRVNSDISFVDLPGFGYAKVSKKIRGSWKTMVETYLSKRENLLAVALLIDIRRGPEKEETELINWLIREGIRYFVVLTKSDKLSKNKQQTSLLSAVKALELSKEDIILFSAKSKKGKAAVSAKISSIVQEQVEKNE